MDEQLDEHPSLTFLHAPESALELTVGDASSPSLVNPTPRQVQEALARLGGGDYSFAILSDSEWRGELPRDDGSLFIQVHGSKESGFSHIEFQDGSCERQYGAVLEAPLSLDEVSSMFRRWMAGDDGFMRGRQWRRIDIQPLRSQGSQNDAHHKAGDWRTAWWLVGIGMLCVLLASAYVNNFTLFWVGLVACAVLAILRQVAGTSVRPSVMAERAREAENRAEQEAARIQLLQRLHALTGREFETMSADLFEQMGYRVTLTPTSRDNGIDLVLRDGQRTILVQCKRQQRPVGVRVLRELFGIVISESADKGIVVTNGSFTTDAEVFARGKRLELVDGATFAKWWAQFAISAERPESATPSPSALRLDTPQAKRIVGWDSETNTPIIQ